MEARVRVKQRLAILEVILSAAELRHEIEAFLTLRYKIAFY